MKNISFLSGNFQFLEVKFSVYLKRRVFVMYVKCLGNATSTKPSRGTSRRRYEEQAMTSQTPHMKILTYKERRIAIDYQVMLRMRNVSFGTLLSI